MLPNCQPVVVGYADTLEVVEDRRHRLIPKGDILNLWIKFLQLLWKNSVEQELRYESER